MQFTPRDMGTAIAITIGITAGAVWYACQNRIAFHKEQLTAYKALTNIDLPSLSSNLSTVSNKLSSQLETLENIDKLQESNRFLDESNNQLKNDILELRKENEHLQEKVESLFSVNKEFTVEIRSSHQFLEGKFSVGVVRVYSDSAEIIFENKNHTVNVGHSFPFKYKEQDCKLTVSSINNINSWATFNVTCEKKAAN